MKTLERPVERRQGWIQFTVTDSWLGRTLVAATEVGICAVFLGDEDDVLEADLHARFQQVQGADHDSGFQRLANQVVQFVHDPSPRWQLPLDLKGTEFQQRVWKELRQIPYGETLTYGEIAVRIGNPKSIRAVASACGANPISVIIPCHRVVRRDGLSSGYRWGIERKQKLLALEQSECR